MVQPQNSYAIAKVISWSSSSAPTTLRTAETELSTLLVEVTHESNEDALELRQLKHRLSHIVESGDEGTFMESADDLRNDIAALEANKITVGDELVVSARVLRLPAGLLGEGLYVAFDHHDVIARTKSNVL